MKNKKNKNLIIEVLFVWSKKYSNISYRQGMNEIIGVLYIMLENYYYINKSANYDELIELKVDIEDFFEYDKYINNVYLYLHDIDYLCADLFSLFEELMNRGIKDLYDFSSVTPSETVKKIDNEINIKQIVTQVYITNISQ